MKGKLDIRNLDCSTGYLVELVDDFGNRYRYGVRKTYLEMFIKSAFNNGCIVECVGFCKIPRNTGIKCFEI